MAASPTNSEIECNGANDGTCPKHPEINQSTFRAHWTPEERGEYDMMWD